MCVTLLFFSGCYCNFDSFENFKSKSKNPNIQEEIKTHTENDRTHRSFHTLCVKMECWLTSVLLITSKWNAYSVLSRPLSFSLSFGFFQRFIFLSFSSFPTPTRARVFVSMHVSVFLLLLGFSMMQHIESKGSELMIFSQQTILLLNIYSLRSPVNFCPKKWIWAIRLNNSKRS